MASDSSGMELVETYGAAWGETDEDARRALLERVWADDGVYCDPTARVEGREAFVAHIGEFQALMPGHHLELTSGIDVHHGWIRFGWRLVAPDGALVLDAMDVGTLDADGRLTRIVGFFGPLPPLAS